MALRRFDVEDGMPWALNGEGTAHTVEEWIRANKPWLPIGSPMCASFSQTDNTNFASMHQGDVGKVIGYGTRHIELRMQPHMVQRRNGPANGMRM